MFCLASWYYGKDDFTIAFTVVNTQLAANHIFLYESKPAAQSVINAVIMNFHSSSMHSNCNCSFPYQLLVVIATMP